MSALSGLNKNENFPIRGRYKEEKGRKFPTRKTLAALALSGVVIVGYNSHGKQTNIPAKNDAVKEYIVKPADTAWNIAQKAYPEQVNDASKQYDLRQEIQAQLPHDTAHEDGMLQPGDKLIFMPNASIGDEMKFQEALNDTNTSSEQGSIAPIG